jgi:hypothetical protein
MPAPEGFDTGKVSNGKEALPIANQVKMIGRK